jgi:hypothetical protein
MIVSRQAWDDMQAACRAQGEMIACLVRDLGALHEAVFRLSLMAEHLGRQQQGAEDAPDFDAMMRNYRRARAKAH